MQRAQQLVRLRVGAGVQDRTYRQTARGKQTVTLRTGEVHPVVGHFSPAQGIGKGRARRNNHQIARAQGRVQFFQVKFQRPFGHIEEVIVLAPLRRVVGKGV